MVSGTSSEESGRRPESSTELHPYWTGAAAGVGAVPFGYLTAVLLTATRALDAVGTAPAPTGDLAGWKAVGWLFYNAHGVAVRFADGTGAVGVDFLEASGSALAPLYLLPPVVLLLAGGVTAFRVGVSGPKRAAVAGATVTTGYSPALLAGSLVFGASVGPYTAAPAVPVLAAVGYPPVFGAMGGLAAAAISTTPAANRAAGPSD